MEKPTHPDPEPVSAPTDEAVVITDIHAQILNRLGPSPLPDDHLIRDIGAPAGQVAAALVDLELDGQINRAAGGLISRPV